MGTIHVFPRRRHARVSSATLKLKTDGETTIPLAFRASVMRRNLSAVILPLVRQFTTADGPTAAREAMAVGPPSASITSSTELSMALLSSRNVNLSSLHGMAVEIRPPVMSHLSMAEQLKSLAKRLKLTREALGLSAAQLCKSIKIKENRWSQYENGERRITLEVANLLCDEFGLTLDWIYRADPAQLGHDLRLRIRQAA